VVDVFSILNKPGIYIRIMN